MNKKNKIDDSKPFNHGDDGTHGCCNEKLKADGGKSTCCECEGCRFCGELEEKYCDYGAKNCKCTDEPQPVCNCKDSEVGNKVV